MLPPAPGSAKGAASPRPPGPSRRRHRMLPRIDDRRRVDEVDVEPAGQVVDLVEERPSEQARPAIADPPALDVVGGDDHLGGRWTSATRSGIERQPSQSTTGKPGPDDRRVAQHDTGDCSTSTTARRSGSPICGAARPTPRAARIVTTISSTSRRRPRSGRRTARVGARKRSSGSDEDPARRGRPIGTGSVGPSQIPEETGWSCASVPIAWWWSSPATWACECSIAACPSRWP